MEKFQISLNELIRIYRFMSVGKLVNGLIHNLNGPLHSLGIEMDVLGHVLQMKRQTDDEGLIENISARLKRMDEEFENLARLIRLSASRMELFNERTDYFSLNAFLEQELEFMKANLYFKHEVQTTLHLGDAVASIRCPKENLVLGLSWVIQGLVEEVERQEMKALDVETRKTEQGAFVRFKTGGGQFSEGFARLLMKDRSTPSGIRDEATDLGTLLAVTLLRSSGVELNCGSVGSAPQLTLDIPYPRGGTA